VRTVLFALVLAGCTAADAPHDAPASVATFVGDPAPAGPAVFVRGHGDASNLYVDVLARGAPDVHGAALRVTFDPDALAFVGSEAAPVWTKKSMALAKEGTPGQLAIAWFAKGERGVAAGDETLLGTLTFAVHGSKGSAIAFKPERSALVDRKGTPVELAFRGGRVVPLAAAAR
jgi:hypothetical protein